MNKRKPHCQNLGEGPVMKGFLNFLEIVTGWLAPSAGQKLSVQPVWYLPPQKIPLAENRFLQAGKGAENTNKKSRQCFKVTKGAFRLDVRDSKVEFPNIVLPVRT
jgi:hypothetical protein